MPAGPNRSYPPLPLCILPKGSVRSCPLHSLSAHLNLFLLLLAFSAPACWDQSNTLSMHKEHGVGGGKMQPIANQIVGRKKLQLVISTTYTVLKDGCLGALETLNWESGYGADLGCSKLFPHLPIISFSSPHLCSIQKQCWENPPLQTQHGAVRHQGQLQREAAILT